MNNLNSLNNNSGANNFNNKKGSKFKFKDVLKKKNLMTVVGVVIAIIALVIIGIVLHKLRATYNENQLKGVQEVQLLKYLFDCKDNQEIIDGGSFPHPAIGNEYNLTFWIYVNNLLHEYQEDKNVLIKGDIADSIESGANPSVKNPRIYIPKNSNSLKLEFQEEGLNEDNVLGCYRTVNQYLVEKINDPVIQAKFKKDYQITDGNKTTDAFDVDKYDSDLNTTGMFFTLHKNFKITFTLDLLAGKDLSSAIPSRETNVIYNLINFTDKDGSTLMDFHFYFNGSEFIMSSTVPITTTQKIDGGYVSAVTKAKTINIVIQSSNNTIIAGIASSDTATYHILKATHTVEQSDCKVFFSKGAVPANSGWNDSTPSEELFKISKFTYKNLDTTKTMDACLSQARKDGADYYSMTYPSTDNTALCSSLTQPDIDLIKLMKQDPKYVKIKDKDCSKLDITDNYDYRLGKETHRFIHSVNPVEETTSCEINNLPIQKWNCISLNIHNNICDIFLDGILHQTCVFKSAIKTNNFPMIMGGTQKGGPMGFDGYLSNINYINKTQTAKEIYNKFEEGPNIMLSLWDRIKSIFQKNS